MDLNNIYTYILIYKRHNNHTVNKMEQYFRNSNNAKVFHHLIQVHPFLDHYGNKMEKHDVDIYIFM